MPRRRDVDPDLFRSERLLEAEIATGLPLRIAFIALWTVCDREGRFPWRPRRLRADAMPLDDVDFAAVLDELARLECVHRYEVNGEAYGAVNERSWKRLQSPHYKETASKIPPPPVVGGLGSGNAPDHGSTKGQNPLGTNGTNGTNGTSGERQSDPVGPSADGDDAESDSIIDAEVTDPEPRHGESAEPPAAVALLVPAAATDARPARVVKPRGIAYPPGFLAAWAAYPHHATRSVKAKAAEVWRRQRLELMTDRVVAWIVAASASDDWRKQGGQYVPGMQTWLNGRDFTDEPPAAKPGGGVLSDSGRQTLEAGKRWIERQKAGNA